MNTTLFQKLLEVVNRRDAQGAYRYSAREIQDAIALVLLRLHVPPESLTPALKQLLGRFAERLGVTLQTEQGEFAQALKRYMVNNPLPATLKQELRQVMQSLIVPAAPQPSTPSTAP